jgi:hypothetical protein
MRIGTQSKELWGPTTKVTDVAEWKPYRSVTWRVTTKVPDSFGVQTKVGLSWDAQGVGNPDHWNAYKPNPPDAAPWNVTRDPRVVVLGSATSCTWRGEPILTG